MIRVVALAHRLPDEAPAALAAAVRDAGGEPGQPRHPEPAAVAGADPFEAIEMLAQGVAVTAARPALARAGRALGVDVAALEHPSAAPGLLVSDVDSTLVRGEVIEMLAAHAGREREVAAVTEQAMRGEIDFAQSLHRRVRELAGLPVAVLDEVTRQVRLAPGATTLVRTLQQHGTRVALVSGGFAEVVVPLADGLGITDVLANRLEVSGGRLTGRVAGTVVDRAAKARELRRLATLHQVPAERTVALGDGANDLDMLAAAGLGIAYNAKPVVQEQVTTTLNLPRLDPVLLMLGLPAEPGDGVPDPGGALPAGPPPAT